MESVKKMPNCAAAPNNSIFGLESKGPKSIMAPMPMKSKSGNSSLRIPALYSVSKTAATPVVSAASATLGSGRLMRIAPKPIGKSNVGSMSFLMAR